MALFYSARRAGFFNDAIHRDLPADAVPITAERHAELLRAQSEGATIKADALGRPVARRVNVPTAQLRAGTIEAIKAEASRRILAVAPLWRQLNDIRALPLSDGQERIVIEKRLALIDAIRAASDRIEREATALTAAALRTFDPTTASHWPDAKDIQP